LKLIRFFVFLLFSALVLTGAHAQAINAIIDPSELAVGGRPLALGRAYVGMANDVYSIFQNVAGLTEINDWQVTSMYADVIQEVGYSLIGIGSSLSQEALGLAYIRAEVSGSRFTKRDPVTGRIVPDGDGAIGYRSGVWFLSYAVEPKKYFSHPFFKDLALGVNVKIFEQALTGLPTNMSALGTDLDIGIKFKPQNWISFGLAGYNVLPYDMGGRLVWASGITESIPAALKLGTSIKLLGVGGLRESVYFPQELYLNYDYEMAVTKQYPGLSHLGIEWRPADMLSLRFGIDQDAVAVSSNEVGIDNDMTAGIGLHFDNVSFDYAFHSFGVLSDNNTHFISVSYGIPREKLPGYAPPKSPMYLEITEPATKSVTFLPNVIIKGKVHNPDNIKDVRVNGISAKIFPDSSFVSVLKFEKFGMNNIKVDVFGTTGRIVDTQYLKVAHLVPFKDVPEGHPLRETIGAMAALEYIKGYKDDTFRPDGKITRAELCTLLVRILATQEVRSPLKENFKDVPLRHWAARFIARAVKEGLFRGYPDGTFKPKNNITRAEAVSVMVNFSDVDKVHYVYEQPFPDISLQHWASKNIFLAKKYGFLGFLAGKKFTPNYKITRGEVVEILSKIDPVKTKLNELLN
jgi:S-layer homology domain